MNYPKFTRKKQYEIYENVKKLKTNKFQTICHFYHKFHHFIYKYIIQLFSSMNSTVIELKALKYVWKNVNLPNWTFEWVEKKEVNISWPRCTLNHYTPTTSQMDRIRRHQCQGNDCLAPNNDTFPLRFSKRMNYLLNLAFVFVLLNPMRMNHTSKTSHGSAKMKRQNTKWCKLGEFKISMLALTPTITS